MRTGLCLLLLLALPAYAENPPCEKLATTELLLQADDPPLIKAALEGKDAPFLFSFINEQSLIHQSLQDAAGLPNLPVPIYYLKSGDVFLDHYVSTKNLTLGGTPIAHTFLVLPDHAGERPVSVLGLDFMFHYKVDFDFAARKMTLFSADHCIAHTGWAEGAATELPFRVDATARPIVSPTLDGQRLLAFLNTWFDHSTLSLEAARDLFGLEPNSPGMEKLDDHTWRHTFAALNLNGVILHDVTLRLQPEATTAFYGTTAAHMGGGSTLKSVKLLIGADLLKRLHLQLAYKQHLFYIAATKP